MSDELTLEQKAMIMAQKQAALGIEGIVTIPLAGDWAERRDAFLRTLTDDQKTALVEFVGWFDGYEGD